MIEHDLLITCSPSVALNLAENVFPINDASVLGVKVKVPLFSDIVASDIELGLVSTL
jgi:hypothetical protein